jgi:hypothetical protein
MEIFLTCGEPDGSWTPTTPFTLNMSESEGNQLNNKINLLSPLFLAAFINSVSAVCCSND